VHEKKSKKNHIKTLFVSLRGNVKGGAKRPKGKTLSKKGNVSLKDGGKKTTGIERTTKSIQPACGGKTGAVMSKKRKGGGED